MMAEGAREAGHDLAVIGNDGPGDIEDDEPDRLHVKENFLTHREGLRNAIVGLLLGVRSIYGTLEFFQRLLRSVVQERECLHHEHGGGLSLRVDPIKGVEDPRPGHASGAAAVRYGVRIDGEAEAELVERARD